MYLKYVSCSCRVQVIRTVMFSFFVFVTVTESAEVRCPRNVSNVFGAEDEWSSEQCGQHEQHLSVGRFYELFLQHPTVDRFDMLCRLVSGPGAHERGPRGSSPSPMAA